MPIRSAFTSRQSNATSGSLTRGEPVSILSQPTPSNLSPEPVLTRPAKTSATPDWLWRSRFTQKTPFSTMRPAVGLWWWTQTRITGGSAVTEVIADTVTPACPASPAVVTT